MSTYTSPEGTHILDANKFTVQAEARLMEFTRSELFAKTFREGMDIVEETAAYLDGPGRQDSHKLDNDDALTPLPFDQNQPPTSFKTPPSPHWLFDLQDSLDKLMHFVPQLSDFVPLKNGFYSFRAQTG